MRCSSSLCGFLLLTSALVTLSGCGGSEEQVAQAPPTAPSTPTPTRSSSPTEDEEPSEEPSEPSTGYGGETYGGESYSGEEESSTVEEESSSGGGGYPTQEDQMAAYYGSGGPPAGSGYGPSSGYGGGRPGYGAPPSGGNVSSGDFPTEEDDGYSGYGSGSGGPPPGYGGPPAGYGGYPGASGGTGSAGNNIAVQFVNQNCMSCHGARSPKGDFRLDGVTDDIVAHAGTWSKVVSVLEDGSMPPSSAPRRPDPNQQAAVVAFLQQSLGGSGGVDVDYWALAQRMFGGGKEAEGLRYFYAHALTAESEEASELFAKERWFAAGKRPTTTIRFAVGAVLDAPSTLTDIKPLGSNLSGGGGGGFGSESFGSRGGSSDADAPREFYKITGDFGRELVKQFESRWQSGDLGLVFNEVVESKPAQSASNPGGGYSGGYGGPGGGPGGPSTEDDGGYGGYTGGGPSSGGGRTATPAVLPGRNVTTGLLYLGTGSQKELLEKAAEAGVDGLFIFDIEAKQNVRTRIINNKTRLRLLLTNGDALAATKTLDNVEVERAKMRGIDDDELEKNMERLFAQFDEKMALTDLPELKPEHALKRVHQLVNDSNVDGLEAMFEAKMFHAQGLLTDPQLETVFQIIMKGNEGVALASGSIDDQKLVLSDYLSDNN